MMNAAGRPVEPVVLADNERAYLERQVRRHRAARSLSERCRIILRCADGLSSKRSPARAFWMKIVPGKPGDPGRLTADKRKQTKRKLV
jgi:hypothetical protein